MVLTKPWPWHSTEDHRWDARLLAPSGRRPGGFINAFHAERDTEGEVRMNPVWMASIIIAGAVAMAGCVSDRKYQEALAETESAKTELATTRAQKSALEQQVKTLKDLNVKFGNEAQAARDELERIQYGRDKERGSAESRTKELEERVKQLAAQNRSLRLEFEDTKRHNETLKSLVARYQKELKDQSRSPGGALAPTMPPSPPGGSMAPPAPSAGKPPEGLPPAGGIMNVNRASSSEMVLLLGVPKDVADRIVSNRPYKVTGELVAKNVVPKETFDMIKDRISVSP
jgi:DNA uptake protein ComE-like DNA-binding protein/outer membrane murein-binding lipoprotein Lpp